MNGFFVNDKFYFINQTAKAGHFLRERYIDQPTFVKQPIEPFSQHVFRKQ